MLFYVLENETLHNKTKNNVNNPKKNKDLLTPFMGVFRDNFYCLKSDLYHFVHEKEFYQNITVFSDWADEYTRDDLLGNFSQVVSPMYGWQLPKGYLSNESFALEYNIS